jgi:hypothetical protein
MFRIRKLLPCALGLALLGAAAVTVPAAAAATDTITIVSAGSTAASVGDLTVVADSTTQITSLTVALLDSTGTDALDPAMTETAQSATANGYQSTWTVATPITEAQLALGNYTIDVTASDAITTLSDPTAGTLIFKDEPSFQLTPLDASVSYDNKTVTLSGEVTITAPDGTVTPYVGQITMASSLETDVTLSTDDNGDFTTTVTPDVTGDWVLFEVQSTPTVTFGQSAASTFTVNVDPVKLTATASTKSVSYGGTVTVSGSVSYLPDTTGATYEPLADTTVDVYDTQNPYTPTVKGTTNSEGDYTITLPSTASTTWTVDAGGSVHGGNRYLGDASVAAPVAVNLPTAITGFHATLSQYGELSYSGCLGLKEKIADEGTAASTTGPVIQYAYYANGPWYTLRWGYARGGSCGDDGFSFSGSGTAPANYAYYRAYYPGAAGSAATTTDGFVSSTSASVLAWKYADRIASLSVSSKTVSKGGKLTVKGVLQYYYGGWHAYKDQLIYVILRKEGSSTWYWIARVDTNASGDFSAKVTDPYSATWSADYYGNSTHLSAGGAEIYVRLKG